MSVINRSALGIALQTLADVLLQMAVEGCR